MAKAKKPESSPSSKAPETKAKAPAKKAAKASGGSPLINTDFAAQSAARMLMNRGASISANNAAPKKESSAFKQMKDALAKPHLASMDSMLNSTSSAGGQAHTPHQNNQKGHAQTYNADVARTGVPRRNPG